MIHKNVKQVFHIPPIKIIWSNWFSWNELKIDARKRQGIKVPNRKSGVYEVKYKNKKYRLTIGKASDLRMRIKQALIKGKASHSAGVKIRNQEDISKIVVRWAVTNRPSAVEEELHKRYQIKFGKLPKYTHHT